MLIVTPEAWIDVMRDYLEGKGRNKELGLKQKNYLYGRIRTTGIRQIIDGLWEVYGSGLWDFVDVQVEWQSSSDRMYEMKGRSIRVAKVATLLYLTNNILSTDDRR